MRIAPPVGFSNPEISRRQVVLPDPDGPKHGKERPFGNGQVNAIHGADKARSSRCRNGASDILEFDGSGHVITDP